MTDKTETAKAPTNAQVRGAAANLLTALVTTVGLFAVFAWLAGVALNKGFGVHVPFVAAWLLLFVGVCVVKTTASEVASTWHSTRVKADINLLAASMAAQDEIRKEQKEGLADIFAQLAKDETDSGAYL